MSGIFKVYEDRAGKWRFRLHSSNGQIVATGEAYETKDAAKRGCKAVQQAAEGAPVVELPSTIVAGFDITLLAAELVAAGHNEWADKVEAIRRDYVDAMRDVASVFHADVMDAVRERLDAADMGHGAPLSAWTGALRELAGDNSLGKTLDGKDVVA